MSFTYTTNIPAAPDNPSTDQPNMQTNTNSINNWVQVNHVGFNTANAGQHTRVDFPTALTPTPTPTGDASVVYSYLVSSIPQLFFANSAGATQLSGFAVVSGANAGTAGGTIFTVSFPNNLTIYCGTTNTISGTSNTVVFPNAFTTGYVNMGTSNGGTTFPITVGTNFTVPGMDISVASNVSVNWLAIGTIA